MKRVLTVALVAAVQLALVAVAVAPQLSARLTGDTLVVRVAPLDPIDPFRGAYVELNYPDLEPPMRDSRRESGDLYVTLVEQNERWVGSEWTRTRPESGTYIKCHDNGWRLACGIESLFVGQRRAQELEREFMRDGAIAEIRVDGRGNAVVLDIRKE